MSLDNIRDVKEEVNKDEIDISARIDLKRNAVFIKPNTGDLWVDFGYWLEVTGTLAAAVKRKRNWSQLRLFWYMFKYYRECLKDFKNDFSLRQ